MINQKIINLPRGSAQGKYRQFYHYRLMVKGATKQLIFIDRYSTISQCIASVSVCQCVNSDYQTHHREKCLNRYQHVSSTTDTIVSLSIEFCKINSSYMFIIFSYVMLNLQEMSLVTFSLAEKFIHFFALVIHNYCCFSLKEVHTFSETTLRIPIINGDTESEKLGQNA